MLNVLLILLIIRKVLASDHYDTDPNRLVPEIGPHYLNNFIVIPEYKLLFCYIEKVGCTSFNHLFVNLRNKTWGSKDGGWYSNSPQALGLTQLDIQGMVGNPEWEKAVFYRHPLDRFLSAYKSKCEEGPHRDGDGSTHCQQALGVSGLALQNKTAAFQTVVNRIKTMDNPYKKQNMDPHWAPQSEFCGGITKNIQFYQTIEFFQPATLRHKTIKLLNKVGVKNPSAIPHFEETFSLNPHEKQRQTGAADAANEYFSNKKVAEDIIKFYLPDYLLFGIPIRSVALDWISTILHD